MTNSFHTSELLKSASNYPVVKGDTPGHEFHGNQWTGGHSKQLMEGAIKVALAYHTGRIDNGQLKTLLQGENPKPYFKGGAIGEHRDISDSHAQMREHLEGHPSEDALYAAEMAHHSAGKAAENVVDTIDKGGSKKDITNALEGWVSSASVANIASNKADSVTPDYLLN